MDFRHVLALLIVTLVHVRAQVGSRIEFQSDAIAHDLTALLQAQHDQNAMAPLGSELIYVTPIDPAHRQHAHSGDMLPNPGGHGGAAAADGGVEHDDMMNTMQTFASDMRDTLLSIPQNFGNAILSTWESNAEHARRKAAEAEKRKPKKPIVHWGKPIMVKKMMRKNERPIVIQVFMPTPAPTQEPTPAPSEIQEEREPPKRRRRPLRERLFGRRQKRKEAQQKLQQERLQQAQAQASNSRARIQAPPAPAVQGGAAAAPKPPTPQQKEKKSSWFSIFGF